MNAVCKCVMILLLSGLCTSGIRAQPPGETVKGQKRDKAVVWKPSASWQAARKEGRAAPRLAILVSDEKQRSQALALQALLEAEAFRNWHGELLERAQLEIVLGEQRLSAALSDTNAIKLGQLVQADYFLVVGMEAQRVHCRVNQFPSTTVVIEFDLAPSAEDRLAKQIALRAFRAMAERTRDPNRIAVAIGSFLVSDPFLKFTDLDRTLHTALRERLNKGAGIDLAERFHTTHLLREFELGRGGLVPSVMVQLTAPASDVLIIGDIEPPIKQKLDSKDIALEFRVRVVSPTGLFEAFDVKFIQPKVDANQAADHIAEAVNRAIARMAKPLKRRANTDGLDSEFQTLKQRVFRLLPSPPQKTGNFFEKGGYRGPWQSGRPAEVERAMRAVENALLLKADQQLLVCAVSLVYEMGREKGSYHYEKPSARQKALLERSCDYIETALALDFNYNTRGIAYTAMTQLGYWNVVPERIQPITERIVRDGVQGGWYPHEVEYSRLTLVNKASDIKTKIEVFRAANKDASTKADARLRLLQALDRHYLLQRHARADADKLRATFEHLRGLADELVKENSALARGMGWYLKASTAFQSEPRDPRWKTELSEAIDAIPAMSKELGAAFPQCNYSMMVHHIVRWASEEDKSPAAMEFTRRYIVRQVEIQNFRHGMVADALLRLLPTLEEDKGRAEAIQWLTPLLEQYNTGGAADFDRMKLARWRNHLQQIVSGAKTLAPEDLVDISLETGTESAKAKLHPTEMRVKKVIAAFDRIWALRCDYNLQDRFGEVFVLVPREVKAARVKGLSPKVTDIIAGNDQLAVGSIDSGLALVDSAGKVVRQFRPGDSPLPTAMVRTVATDGSRFFLGLPGRNEQTGYGVYLQYELDPQADTLKKTETKMSYHAYHQMRFDKSAKQVVPQTWDERFYEADGARWTFRRTIIRDAIHQVTVTDKANKPIFTHTGFELNYVYDFAFWQGRLFFATGNGLYAARSGSDQLTCVMNDLDLEFFSLCPVGDKLFVGTNRGLHRLDAEVLAQLTRHEKSRKK